MQREIKNKSVLVTGGADGIGFQIARNFLKCEAKSAIIVDINEDAGNKAVAALNSEFGNNKAVFIKFDVTKDLEEVWEKIPIDEIDVLINSAAIPEEDPDKSIDINLKATVRWAYKFMESKRKDNGGDGGTIINISSIFGLVVTPFYPVYHATKFGVIGFTRSLGHREMYQKTGVRVIALCPGFTKTNFIKGVLDPASPLRVKEMVSIHPWQTPEAVGEKSVEIYREAGSGTIWKINGGVVTEVK